MRFLLLLFVIFASIPVENVQAQSHVPIDWRTRIIEPSGYTALCKREPEYCKKTRGNLSVRYTNKVRAQLELINRDVNEGIEYVSDEIRHGTPDLWERSVHHGDCEEYALRKRDLLLAMGGYPPGALVFGWVIDTTRGRRIPHLVLVVKTSKADFILDNLRPFPYEWHASNHVWVAIQASDNPRIWYAVDDRRIDLRKEKLAEKQKK